jgi:nucleoside recognition membrane protein YjiH
MSDPPGETDQLAAAALDDDVDIPVRQIVGQWLRVCLILLMVLGTGWLALRAMNRVWLLFAVIGLAFLLMGAAILMLLETVPLTLAALFVSFQKRQHKKRGD